MDGDAVYELLEACFAAGVWSLLDVYCMCASSKLLRSAWLQLLRQQPDPAWLLAAVADAANARTPKLQAKATAVVRWLLHSLPEARLAEHPSVPAGLLAIPSVPCQLAETLCKLGVKVPYKEIVAAARQRVEGVEVWIVAQSSDRFNLSPTQSCRRASDIPPLIRKVYKGWGASGILLELGLFEVDDADVPDILHLSINSTSATT
uniref:Uncharacterized protein n=1 Tax=Tetradesmus obliquus TaxID=3088 RepID=A0A383WCZ2_TETOB|eukprot:jgi/Sobl393_1/5932/SZX75497.1